MDALKPSRIAMIVAASAGLPYFLSDPSAQGPTQGEAELALETSISDGGAIVGRDHRPGQGAILPGTPLEGASIQHLGQVLRFDVSVPWILSTWPRVTTGLADLQLHGYRVPLVTGTRPADLAGALTYYFDREQRAARILFRGTTGDPSELVQFLHQHYGFERVLVNDPGLHLYQVKRWGQVRGEVRIRSTPVVREDTPFQRFEVALILDRP